jgi:glutaconyl-CoA/methylmalonyl-CoA decarboxylase subunit gamma
MKSFKFKIFGNEYSVKVKEIEAQTIILEVNGSEYTVEMEKEIKATKTPVLARSQPKTISSPVENTLASKSSTRKLTAPLPGVILEVLTEEGVPVKAGQTLIVMEAMKMENNILAEHSGVVKSLKVRKGDAVLQGDLLIEIE